jgi:Flp pilus assembly pilin Flp
MLLYIMLTQALWQVRNRFTDERGQTLAEYGIILAVVAVAVVVLAVVAFREAIIGAFNAATDCLDGSC